MRKIGFLYSSFILLFLAHGVDSKPPEPNTRYKPPEPDTLDPITMGPFEKFLEKILKLYSVERIITAPSYQTFNVEYSTLATFLLYHGEAEDGKWGLGEKVQINGDTRMAWVGKHVYNQNIFRASFQGDISFFGQQSPGQLQEKDLAVGLKLQLDPETIICAGFNSDDETVLCVMKMNDGNIIARHPKSTMEKNKSNNVCFLFEKDVQRNDNLNLVYNTKNYRLKTVYPGYLPFKETAQKSTIKANCGFLEK